MQLLSGCSILNDYLFKIKRYKWPNCSFDNLSPETVEHYLLVCSILSASSIALIKAVEDAGLQCPPKFSDLVTAQLWSTLNVLSSEAIHSLSRERDRRWMDHCSQVPSSEANSRAQETVSPYLGMNRWATGSSIPLSASDSQLVLILQDPHRIAGRITQAGSWVVGWVYRWDGWATNTTGPQLNSEQGAVYWSVYVLCDPRTTGPHSCPVSLFFSHSDKLY